MAGCTAAPAREAASPNAALALPTIVSLNPCTDAILAEVAAPAQILAISHYSQDPAGSSMDLATARQFRATGGSVEEVLALRPDVVVDGTFTPPATRSALERLGLKLEQVPIAATVPDSVAQVRRLAALAGHPQRGEALVRRIEAALAASKAPAGPPVDAIVWQGGGIVAGEGTLITALLEHTGFSNVAAARGLSQASHLPLEAMLAQPPRVILAAGHSHGEEDRLLAHPALAGLKRTTRAPLEPKLLWCGGPTIPKTLARLAEVRRTIPLPLAGGARGGPSSMRTQAGPPPTPPARGRGE
ncbi:ABC transporter substrate-binding protein [Novosphingobium ginsenosidimutans]|uniref:ABC transporter substrate-binding protein n=1 Tax=Novosphingobium ginsenosidimutans TaxID=1176536 RepID=A0A5B8S781_9SPHN|nr:ABC transporter substrate-binding protein [Novosphingobium ginsenosidimutans]